VWVNSGYYDEHNTKLNNLYTGDEALFVDLDRSEDGIIPLGWYLSEQATTRMQEQLSEQTAEVKKKLTRLD
jgi:hypothetical protein